MAFMLSATNLHMLLLKTLHQHSNHVQPSKLVFNKLTAYSKMIVKKREKFLLVYLVQYTFWAPSSFLVFET